MADKKPLRAVQFPPPQAPSTWNVEIRDDPKSRWKLHKSGLDSYDAALAQVPSSYRDKNNYRIREVHPDGPAEELPPLPPQPRR